mmetsp:Transcript_39323/g.53334  ORF Transcript_39323/g.53334 Transcript_39323/m.53334 type:complete len:104 (+) Transcript_39323:902-1213(+)
MWPTKKKEKLLPKSHVVLTSEIDGAAATNQEMNAEPLETPEGPSVFHRYCHVYRPGELEDLCKPLVAEGWIRIEQVYYDTGNMCMVLRKTAPMPIRDEIEVEL